MKNLPLPNRPALGDSFPRGLRVHAWVRAEEGVVRGVFPGFQDAGVLRRLRVLVPHYFSALT